MASPGFAAKRDRDGNCHGALTVDFRAGCSSCSMTNSFVVTNAVLIERAVVVDICIS